MFAFWGCQAHLVRLPLTDALCLPSPTHLPAGGRPCPASPCPASRCGASGGVCVCVCAGQVPLADSRGDPVPHRGRDGSEPPLHPFYSQPWGTSNPEAPALGLPEVACSPLCSHPQRPGSRGSLFGLAPVHALPSQSPWVLWQQVSLSGPRNQLRKLETRSGMTEALSWVSPRASCRFSLHAPSTFK